MDGFEHPFDAIVVQICKQGETEGILEIVLSLWKLLRIVWEMLSVKWLPVDGHVVELAVYVLLLHFFKQLIPGYSCFRTQAQGIEVLAGAAARRPWRQDHFA